MATLERAGRQCRRARAEPAGGTFPERCRAREPPRESSPGTQDGARAGSSRARACAAFPDDSHGTRTASDGHVTSGYRAIRFVRFLVRRDRPGGPAPAGASRARAADVCVVGAGFTGISAALHLAERGYSVVVLEAERVGWGASGRNGGQVGSGLRESIDDLERALGPSRAGSLWALAEEAKAIIAERIARHGIECDWRPGNLLASTRERHMGWMEAEAEFCHRRFGYRGYRMLSRAEMREEVASGCYVGGRMDEEGGHLHPLRFVLGMAVAAEGAGARIFEGSRVERIRWGGPAEVSTAQGVVAAEHVVLAGNAHLGRLESSIESRIMPIVNHQLATEPLGERRARSLVRSGACVHSTKFVVDYFRCTPDHRLLFGGGETYSDRPRATSRGSSAATCSASSPSSRTFASTTRGAGGSQSRGAACLTWGGSPPTASSPTGSRAMGWR